MSAERLTGWRVGWLDQHLTKWRREIDGIEHSASRRPEWIARERSLIREYETLLLESKYPSTPSTLSEKREWNADARADALTSERRLRTIERDIRIGVQ